MACPQVGLGRAEHREKLRGDQLHESEHHCHRNSLEPPAQTDLIRWIRGEERSYTPGVVGVGQVQQLRHPDACAHMGRAGRVDTIMRVTVGREKHYHIDDYRLREVVEGGNMPHCNRVHRCVVDTAFRLL